MTWKFQYRPFAVHSLNKRKAVYLKMAAQVGLEWLLFDALDLSMPYGLRSNSTTYWYKDAFFAWTSLFQPSIMQV